MSSHQQEQKNQIETPAEIIAAMEIVKIDTDKLVYHLQNTISAQTQQCQWTRLADGKNIKIIQCDNLGHFDSRRHQFVCVVQSNCSQTGNEEPSFFRSALIDFGFCSSILEKYSLLGRPRSLVVSIGSNMRDEKSCSFLIAANFGRSTSISIPDDVIRTIEQFCPRLFNEYTDLSDLDDEDDPLALYFDDLDLWVCDKGDNDIQIAIVLYDDNITSLLCYLRTDGIKMQLIDDDDKFDECMAQSGHDQITLETMQIDSIDLPFADFQAFIERNFSAISSVDIVHNLFVEFLNITRWKTSVELRGYLKTISKN